jgi:exonuclease SbcC
LEKLAEERRTLQATHPTELEKLNNLKRRLDDFKSKKTELDSDKISLDDLLRTTENLRKDFREKDRLLNLLETYQKISVEKNQIEQGIKGKKEFLGSLKSQIQQLESKEQSLTSIRRDLEKYRGLDSLDSQIREILGTTNEAENQEVRLKTREEPMASALERIKVQEQDVERHPGALAIQEATRMRKNTRTLTVIGLLLTIIGVALTFVVGPLASIIIVPGIGLLIYGFRQGAKASTVEITHNDYLARLEVLRTSRESYQTQEGEISGLRSSLLESKKTLYARIAETKRYSDVLDGDLRNDPVGAAKQIKIRYDSELQDKKLLEAKAGALHSDISRKPGLENELNKTSDAIEELQRKSNSCRFPDLPADIVYSESVLAETRKEVTKKRERISGNEEAIRNLKESVGKLANFIEENKEIPRLKEEQERTFQQLERRLRIVAEARAGMEKTTEILRGRVRPNVERYMGLFLPAVTLGRYKAVQLDEDYNLLVYDPEAGEFRPRDIFSGGTEDQFLLVMRLAFALALMPEAKGTRPEFLFLDEPLGSSDEFRRTGIMTLLKTELAQYFRQIFLVSHVQGIEQDVDHIIKLETGRVVEQV